METFEARVVAAYGRECLIQTETGEQCRAVARGRSDTPVCNDLVKCSRADGLVSVESVTERQRIFWRYDRRSGRRALASNIDLLGIVVAAEPAAETLLLDRYIAAAELNAIAVALIWTKADMQEADTDLVDTYRQIGYPVIEVSALTGAGMDTLTAMLEGRTTLLSGLSGVGKSSLINQLVPDAAARTAALSAASGEGTHTTTSATVYPMADGRIIDTPGVRDYYLWPMPADELIRGYRELSDAAEHCRFRNCSHGNEPGCGVLGALEQGNIDPQRYRRYLKLAQGLSRQHEVQAWGQKA